MENQQKESPPPIFKTWNQMYAFVLIVNVILIIIFYIITQTYS